MSEPGHYSYPFPRPMVTVDAVVFTIRDDALCVLLIRRKHDPFKGRWAIPGGFVDPNEPLEEAVARELDEETGVAGVKLTQFQAFGDRGRDPRGHTITVAYYGATHCDSVHIRAADDAAEASWVGVGDHSPLAFDHDKILARALTCLLKELDCTRTGDSRREDRVSHEEVRQLIGVMRERGLA